MSYSEFIESGSGGAEGDESGWGVVQVVKGSVTSK